MGFLKNQSLKNIDWLDDSSNVMVYKFPMEGRYIMCGSTLTVRESQVAIFMCKGRIADVFGPGKHKLIVSNLPILSTILAWPRGFKSDFTADVFFVNTKQFPNQKWGTTNPITMRDKEFGSIRIRGYGSYSFRVSDAAVFLKELFGTNSTFTTEDITSYLKSMLISAISDTIAESKISALDLACNLMEFNKTARAQVSEHFAKLGLEITNLVIENISFPEVVEKAIDTRSSMGVLKDSMDTYVKYQSAEAIKDAAKNPGMAGLGTQMATGMVMGDLVRESLNTVKTNNQTQTQGSNAGYKFCPECGAKNVKASKFCSECGKKFPSDVNVCSKCGAKISPNSKFCPECGNKI